MGIEEAIVRGIAVLMMGGIIIAIIAFGFIRMTVLKVTQAGKRPSGKTIEEIEQELERLKGRVRGIEEKLSKVP